MPCQSEWSLSPALTSYEFFLSFAINLIHFKISLHVLHELLQASAEQLQMANYGLGGHYEPHYDMATAPGQLVQNLNDPLYGNRIATGLFYVWFFKPNN